MSNASDAVDWNKTTWEGSRREQLRRWSQLTLDEIFVAQEEMAALAEEIRLSSPSQVSTQRSPDSNAR